MIDMTFSLSEIISVGTQLAILIVAIMQIKASIAVMRSEMQSYREKSEENFKRLEQKQDKYNNLIQRVTTGEVELSQMKKSLDEAHNKIRRLDEKSS